MLPDLLEIKRLRKQFNLTQSELARIAGVSQSLVAKIESEKIIPSYSNAKKLFDTLEKLNEETELKAKDVMTQKIVFVNESDSVKKAIKTMESHALSQVPIVVDGKSVGTISEKTILSKLGDLKNANLSAIEVKTVMDDSMPLIQENTPIGLVSQMLAYNSAVLVAEKGKIKGIIAKADLLKAMISKQ